MGYESGLEKSKGPSEGNMWMALEREKKKRDLIGSKHCLFSKKVFRRKRQWPSSEFDSGGQESRRKSKNEARGESPKISTPDWLGFGV